MLSFVGVFDVLIPTFALKETARCLFHPDEEGARGASKMIKTTRSSRGQSNFCCSY
jgi:metal-dependent amidase/aminoacylase/carboxypeptidase family protein